MPKSVFAQPLSKSSLVYLFLCHPALHTPYITSPNHCLLFATHDLTITTCFAVVPRSCHQILVSLTQLLTWNSAFYLSITSILPFSFLPSEVNVNTHARTHARTHTHTQPFYGCLDFVWDNSGQPVPEETFTHSHLSWSSIILYLLHPSTINL